MTFHVCTCGFEDGEQTMWCDTHLTERNRTNEMIELLKQSRANGDVLAELVEKTEELKSKDGHIRKVREMVLAHADADVVAQLSRLEQAPTDGKTLCWHVCHEPSHFEPGGLYDGWVRPTVCPQCGEQSQ